MRLRRTLRHRLRRRLSARYWRRLYLREVARRKRAERDGSEWRRLAHEGNALVRKGQELVLELRRENEMLRRAAERTDG